MRLSNKNKTLFYRSYITFITLFFIIGLWMSILDFSNTGFR